MKRITNISILASLLIALPACNDDFLDRFPETSIGKENFFNTEEDLNMYVNNLYNFPGHGIYIWDNVTDNQATTGATEMKTIMTTTPSSQTVVGGWNWGELRTINFFLENFSKADIPQDQLDHFEGLARFFRARFYMDKVQRYSDVPWYDEVLGTADEELLYKAQDPRQMVVEKIFEDYEFAAGHVNVDEPAGAVNRWVVKQYMARHALYEGTYRKYHDELGLQGSANGFLELARDLAKEIMDSGNYAIHNTGNPESDYYSLFVNPDLSNNPEVILATIYVPNLWNSGNWAYMFGNYESSPSRDLLQAYLMKDGTPYTSQADYETNLFVEEFVDRDPRLKQTYAYPGWELRRTETYAQGGGVYIQQLQKNFSGYHQLKGYVNDPDQDVFNDQDVPVLRYAETLLIYAEARAELGQLTQADLDMTVNVLRDRAAMPHLTMNPPVDPVQQARYPNVTSPELLEIRRERRIELALEGYRFDDLMRWKAGPLIEAEPQGLYFPGLGKYDLTGDGVEDILLIDVSEDIPSGPDKEVNSLGKALIYYKAGPQNSSADVYLQNGTSGTVQTDRERGLFMEPKNYYRPIPQTHVTVNPHLKQIFGWN